MNSDKEVVAAGASRDSLADDVSSLRQDMAKMHDILTRFTSEAGGQAARTVRNVSQTVASQVGSTASGIASTSADMAASATQQFKTFTNELRILPERTRWGRLPALWLSAS